MTELMDRERSFKLGNSSEQAAIAFTESNKHNTRQHQPQQYQQYRKQDRAGIGYGRLPRCKYEPWQHDPFRASLHTSRETREARHERLFGQARKDFYGEPRLFHRSRGNIPEYGSFSRFNAMLKQAGPSVLER